MWRKEISKIIVKNYRNELKDNQNRLFDSRSQAIKKKHFNVGAANETKKQLKGENSSRMQM